MKILNQNSEILIILLLIAIFIATRFLGLSNQSLWIDEINLVRISQELSLFSNLADLIKNEPHPPLFFLISSIWVEKFNSSEASYRLLSIVFTSAFTIVFGVFSYRKFGFKQAYISLIVVICSFSLLHYSQNFRPYAAIFFVGALILWALHILTEKPTSVPRLGILFLFLLLGGLIHYSILIFTVSIAIYWGADSFIRKERKIKIFRIAVFVFAICLAALPGFLWYAIVFEPLEAWKIARMNGSLGVSDYLSPVRAIVGFPGLLLMLAVTLVSFGGKNGVTIAQGAHKIVSDRTIVFCVAIFLIHYLLIGLVSIYQASFVQNKNFVIAFPLAYFAIARFLTLFVEDWRHIHLATLLGVLGFTTYIVTGYPHHKESYFDPWREQIRVGAKLVLKEARPGDVVLFGSISMNGVRLYPTLSYIKDVWQIEDRLSEIDIELLPPIKFSLFGEEALARQRITRLKSVLDRLLTAEANQVLIDLPHSQKLKSSEWDLIQDKPLCVQRRQYVGGALLILRLLKPGVGCFVLPR